MMVALLTSTVNTTISASFSTIPSPKKMSTPSPMITRDYSVVLQTFSSTTDTGHQAILEMHATSESSALLYVVVVLALYVLALIVVMNKYFRSDHYENRLSSLYESFWRRDSFLSRWSKRRRQQQQQQQHQRRAANVVSEHSNQDPGTQCEELRATILVLEDAARNKAESKV